MRGNGSSKFIELLVFLFVLLAASGCAETPDSGNESASVNESATYWPTEGWRTSTPEQQGMDSEKLAELLDYVEKNDVNIHSLLIIRNGYVVTDVYFYPLPIIQYMMSLPLPKVLQEPLYVSLFPKGTFPE